MRPNCSYKGWLWFAERTTVALLTIFFFAMPAQAVVVLKKGAYQPIVGHLVRQDERTIVVREELPGGEHREAHIPRAEIDELIETVSAQQLAALDPAQPQAYREYAEELAEKRRDPEARDAARRLYIIAAARGDDALRKGALLGLIALARSPAEERRIRAAAYLHDQQHDVSVLIKPQTVVAPQATATAPPTELLAAVRLIRQGRGAEAKALLDLPHVRRATALLADCVTIDELLAAAAARALSDKQLTQILESELLLAGGATRASTATESPWSQTIKSGQLAPLPSLKLQTLIEFDPAECVFRSGKWTRP